MKGAALIVAVTLLAWGATGCGSAKHAANACHGPAQMRALAKLRVDLAAMKSAGKIRVKNTLLGGAALNAATDRFLLDVAKAPISNLQRNRLIDLAARDAVAQCQQCFQALEAARPVPSIAHEGTGASC